MLHLCFAITLLFLATLPTLLIFRNFPLFQLQSVSSSKNADNPSNKTPPNPGVSVLIPARNEELGLAETLSHVLANQDSSIEVIVLDDHSEDRTAAIVEELAAKDSRLRLERSKDLPEGWNGKQHACWQLAEHANHNLLLFLDADVHISKDCIDKMTQQIEQTQVDLLSGFPRQELGSLSECMLIPMMYYVLLGYLPLDQMRAKKDPQFGAGCGQMFLARRKAYFESDGHQAIHGSRHDGLKLPRSFRSAGFSTDLIDASDLASVRMYEGWKQVRIGLLKNATEGIANWKLIIVFSILLLGGSVLPILTLGHALFWNWSSLGWTGIAATCVLGAASLVNWIGAARIHLGLNHPILSLLLHPPSVAIFVAMQWTALLREQLGMQPVAWRGRS
ncbi:MAG: glycosyltransferase family 2 protein [Planctomycetota bacterium]